MTYVAWLRAIWPLTFYFLIWISFQGCDFGRQVGEELGVSGTSIDTESSLKVGEDGEVSVALDQILSDSDDFNINGYSAQWGSLELTSPKAGIYRPFKDVNGEDVLTFELLNQKSGQKMELSIAVDIASADDNPSTYDDVFLVSSLSKPLDVLKNDIDVDGDNLQIVSVTKPKYGQATIVGDQIQYTQADESKKDDQFEYTIDDGSGRRSTGTVYITNSETAEFDIRSVPIRTVFLKSGEGEDEKRLTNQPNVLGRAVAEQINNAMSVDRQSLLKVSLVDSLEIRDDELFKMCDVKTCDGLATAINRYGVADAITILFVDEIIGSVVGVSRVNYLPQTGQAVVVAELSALVSPDSRDVYFAQKVFLHELGHLIGIDHTQEHNVEEDEFIKYPDCGLQTGYWQKSGSRNTGEFVMDGKNWGYYNNLMKSTLLSQSKIDGFMTEGYGDIFQKILACYRERSAF